MGSKEHQIVDYLGIGEHGPYFLHDDALVLTCGNSLRILQLGERGVKNSFFRNLNAMRGVAALNTNPRLGLVAYSCHGVMQSVKVLRYEQGAYDDQSGEEIATLNGGVSLDYSCVAISRDGSRVMGVGSSMDHKLVVWDLNQEKPLAGVEGFVKHGCKSCSFNPLDGDWLCTTGPGGVTFWHIERMYENFSLTTVPGDDAECVAHTWSPDGFVFVVNIQGELAKYDPETGKIVAKVSLGPNLVGISLTLDHLIASCSDGALRWLNAMTFEEESKQTLMDETQAVVTDASHLALSSSCETLVAVSRNGTLHRLRTAIGQAKAELLFDVHGGCIAGVAPIYSAKNVQSLFASVGIDSSIRVWNAKKGLGQGNMCCVKYFLQDGALCSVESSPNSPLLAVGSVSGFLRFVHVKASAKSMQIVEVDRVRAFKTALSSMKFSPDAKIIATSSLHSDKVFLFMSPTDQSFCTLSVEISLSSSHPPTALAWSDAKTIVIAQSDGCYSVDVKMPTEPGEVSVLKESEKLVDLDGKTITCLVPFSMHENHIAICTPEARELMLWSQSSSQSSQHLCKSHEKGLSTIGRREQSSTLITGCFDGSIALWPLEFTNGSKLTSQPVEMCILTHAISSTCVTIDGECIIASDISGGILLFKNRQQARLWNSPVKISSSVFSFKPLSRPRASIAEGGGETEEDGYTEYEKRELVVAREKQRACDLAKESRRKLVNQIQDRLNRLLETNQNVPELEKLDRAEFIIDLQKRNRMLADAEEKAEELRKKITRENMGRDFVAERIKTECWDSMEVKSKELAALQSGLRVRNFPVPVEDPKDRDRINRIVNMRKVELREIRASNEGKPEWQASKLSGLTSKELNWVFLAEKLSPIIDQGAHDASLANEKNKQGTSSQDTSEKESARAANDEEDDEDGTSAAGDGEENAEPADGPSSGPNSDQYDKDASLVGLLYNPIGLRSGVQKRVQITLLRALRREIMCKFNDHFEAMYAAKEDDIDRIVSKNERIKEILKDLSSNEECFEPRWAPTEQPQSIITVEDEEIGVEKYLSKAERERLHREQEERLRREAEAAKDNLGERALLDMMNGTLEAKKEIALQVDQLEAPQWMNELDFADMNDEQRKEFNEFEAKKKALEAEREKYRKGLELELKKIRTEVSEIASQFDERLSNLFELKVKILQSITAQELYEFRLALSLLEDEHSNNKQKETLQTLAELKNKCLEKLDQLNEFKRRTELHRQALQKKQEEDKALERSFKTTMQEYAASVNNGEPIDHEKLKTMLQLFRSRAGRRRSSLDGAESTRGSMSSLLMRRNSTSKRSFVSKTMGLEDSTTSASLAMDSSSTLDPYRDMDIEDTDSRESREREEALAPLDQRRDCPEGFTVDSRVWEMLQQLRRGKIKSEIELKSMDEEFTMMNDALQEIQAEFDSLRQEIFQLSSTYEYRETAMKYDADNAEILIKIKQGQDEIAPKQIINDYEDSVLIHRTVVEHENVEIRRLGQAKVATMNKMKDFRKNINYMEWERLYMEQRKHDLEEHYTDLHMLRVTRSLQEKIKGGDTNENQEQAQKVETRLIQMKRAHEEKVSKLQASLERSKQKAADLERENKALDARIEQLQTSVSIRRNIQGTSMDAVERIDADENLEDCDNGDEQGNMVDPVPAGSGACAAKARMKRIVTRRRLMDLARAQTEEIEYLRQELDRLRERSFPLFARSSGAYAYAHMAPANPDSKV